MKPIEKKKQIELIKKAFSALEFLDNLTHTPYREKLYLMIYNAEKNHRKFKPSHIESGISIANAAKYFTLKYIFEVLDGQKTYQVKDLLMYRFECFYAQAIAENYRTELEVKLHDFDAADLFKYDYAELMS